MRIRLELSCSATVRANSADVLRESLAWFGPAAAPPACSARDERRFTRFDVEDLLASAGRALCGEALAGGGWVYDYEYPLTVERDLAVRRRVWLEVADPLSADNPFFLHLPVLRDLRRRLGGGGGNGGLVARAAALRPVAVCKVTRSLYRLHDPGHGVMDVATAAVSRVASSRPAMAEAPPTRVVELELALDKVYPGSLSRLRAWAASARAAGFETVEHPARMRSPEADAAPGGGARDASL